MNVRTIIIRSVLVLLAAIVALVALKYFTQHRKPALVVRLSKLPTPITNGLFEFAVTVSNASRSDMFVGTIQLQNNPTDDLSPRAYPSTIYIGDDGVAPGTTLSRIGWSAFPNGAKDRVLIGYAREPGGIEARLREWFGRVPLLRKVLPAPKGQYGVSEWFQAPLDKRSGTFDGFGAITPPLGPSNLAKLNLPE